MTDSALTQDDLARIVWTTSHADEGTISYIGSNKIAKVLAEHLSDKPVISASSEAHIKAEALDEAVAALDSMLTASLSPDSGYVKQGRDLLRLLTERANKIRSEA